MHPLFSLEILVGSGLLCNSVLCVAWLSWLGVRVAGNPALLPSDATGQVGCEASPWSDIHNVLSAIWLLCRCLALCK